MGSIEKARLGQVEIIRQYDDEGGLESEFFRVEPFILLARQKQADGGFEETYLVNGKVVAAGKYSQARGKFPDMPEADTALDGVGAILVAVRKIKRPSAHPVLKVDHAQRDEIERHAKRMLAEPDCYGVSRFSGRKDLAIGSLSILRSRNLLEKLSRLGAISIAVFGVRGGAKGPLYACGIVMKLPVAGESRAQLIQIANKAVVKAGFDPHDDVGQRFAVFEP